MTARRDLLQDALAAIERLQAQIDEGAGSLCEPIAIVGAGCRFPGGIDSPESLWHVVRSGIDVVTDVPAERWDAAAYYDADPNAPGKMVTKRGGFLSNVDRFDAQFFGISPREATTMDPQQRLLLETAYEALERAGIPPDRMTGTATGVFVGITTSDYGQLLRLGGPDASDVYSATGSALNAAAGRIAFTFGFQGPCVAVDTACSSSLVAVHLACQSLRTRESDLALAGGVNVVLSPDAMVLFSKWGMMAPDGACKTFDESADGFVRAEGCAMIALKRLADARASGDPILAVIRGSAVNSDGRSSGLTVPNGLAQQAVVRRALTSAGLEPADIDYVEAHGTGTSLGDPIEVEALGTVMGKNRAPGHPLLIGSIKTNLGHTEAASGLAGLLKVALALQHDTIPPHLHLSRPSPAIPWDDYPISVPTSATPWPRGARIRRAGVSSFGFSGTNAHVVLEEAPLAPAVTSPSAELRVLVPFGARDDVALRVLVERHAEFLEAHPDASVADVAATLSTGRSHGPRRLAVLADSARGLAADLRAYAQGEPPASASDGHARLGERLKVAFLFTGQGAQYAGMGRGLYDTEPVFRAVIDRAAAVLAPTLPEPLVDVLFPAEGSPTRLGETAYTQPALFALEFALAELWQSWGITPTLVAGHSVGEYVAASVAGVFSFEAGLALVAERGRLMQQLPDGGSMAAVFAPEPTVAPFLSGVADRVAVAGLNGPQETVISGDGAEVDRIMAELTAAGIECKRLDVSHAFHSPLLEPMLDAFERRAREVTYQVPRVPLVSNLTGRVFAPGERPDASYWRRHAREPVRFAACVETLRQAGVTALVEVGPHPTLLALAGRAVPEAPWTSTASLRRGRDERREILSALGVLFTRGAVVNWEAVRGGRGRRRGDLPTYPFQRERYWISGSASGGAGEESNGHPLLGTRVDLAAGPAIHVWQRTISLDSHPWLRDHRVQGVAIVPATAYIEMAFAAAGEILGHGGLSASEIENLKPILLHDGAARTLQTVLHVQPDGSALFSAHSRPIGDASMAWTTHATARIARLETAAETQSGLSVLELARAHCTREVEGRAFYTALDAKGNQWGPAFQGLEQVWIGEGEAVGRVRTVPSIGFETDRYRFHPALSDACGHVLVATVPLETSPSSTGGAFVGGGVGEVRLHQSPAGPTLWVHAKLRRGNGPGRVVHGDLYVYDGHGNLITETLDARLWYLDDAAHSELLGAPSDWFYAVEWETRSSGPSVSRASDGGTWIIVGDKRGVGAALASRRPDTLLLAPEDAPHDYAGVLGRTPACTAIVYLACVDTPRGDSVPGDVSCARDSCAADLVTLVQAIVSSPLRSRPRVWIVSSAAHAVLPTDRVTSPWGAAVWGLGRTLSAEHAEFWGGLIDLDSAMPAGASARFVEQEVASADREDKIAIRGERRFVPRLHHRAVETPAREFRASPDAAYLVTGGQSGVGLEMAHWLVDRGANHVVLVARTALPPRESWSALDTATRVGRRVAAIVDLESRGVGVETAALDVGDGSALDAWLGARAGRKAPPIRGVIHAAGVLDFKALAEQDPTELTALLAGKADGAWNLHCSLRNEPLDLFVLCSSSSALLSSPLLGGYAAANAFLDALAHFRRARDLPALSVNWGTWGETGMAAEGGRSMSGDMLRGMGTISTAKGLAALGALIDQREAQAAVMPVDWQTLAAAYPAMTADPFLGDLATAVDNAQLNEGSSHADMVLSATPDVRPVALLNYLRHEAARILGLTAERLDPVVPLSSLGFDSLMAVQLKNRIESDLSVVVPMVQFLQGPSVGQLTDLTLTGLGLEAPAHGPVAPIFEHGTL